VEEAIETYLGETAASAKDFACRQIKNTPKIKSILFILIPFGKSPDFHPRINNERAPLNKKPRTYFQKKAAGVAPYFYYSPFPRGKYSYRQVFWLKALLYFLLLPVPVFPWEQWTNAGLICLYSGGTAADSHSLP